MRAADEGAQCLLLARYDLAKLPADVASKLKLRTSEDANAYGGTVPVSIDVLWRLSQLEKLPGIRETFKQLDVNDSGSIDIQEVEAGMMDHCGIQRGAMHDITMSRCAHDVHTRSSCPAMTSLSLGIKMLWPRYAWMQHNCCDHQTCARLCRRKQLGVAHRYHYER